MATLPAIMRTTAARLSALYLILFAACAAILVFYMTSVSVSMMVSQTQSTINEEVLGLGRAYQRGGLPTLVRVVEARSRQPGANLYIIADPNGRILSGNVQSLDPGVLDIEGWTERPFAYARFGETATPTQEGAGETTHTAAAMVFRLPNQMIILVGRDLGEPERFRDVVRNSMAIALGMMGLGAFLIWFFVGRRALKRIDSVSDASRRIMGGDLNGRLPVTGAGDEFDRLSDNLNQMLSRIAALNEGLKQVSDNIAHDLKTPLTRLRNRAEAALAASSGDGAYREALETTIAESDQLIRTFNAILMISRLEAGNASEMADAVDVADIVRDVTELYEALAEEQGVEMSVDIGQVPTIKANRELLGQALSNVVDNAIKYCVESAAPRVAVALAHRGGEIILTVSDNGPGVPEADRQRVTERFVRLERSRNRPGSGLGLSIAKAILGFHGGRLELDDAKPGLIVRMVLPAVVAAS